eukprot:2269212-Amphidinium_carterae.2
MAAHSCGTRGDEALPRDEIICSSTARDTTRVKSVTLVKTTPLSLVGPPNEASHTSGLIGRPDTREETNDRTALDCS